MTWRQFVSEVLSAVWALLSLLILAALFGFVARLLKTAFIAGWILGG